MTGHSYLQPAAQNSRARSVQIAERFDFLAKFFRAPRQSELFDDAEVLGEKVPIDHVNQGGDRQRVAVQAAPKHAGFEAFRRASELAAKGFTKTSRPHDEDRKLSFVCRGQLRCRCIESPSTPVSAEPSCIQPAELCNDPNRL